MSKPVFDLKLPPEAFTHALGSSALVIFAGMFNGCIPLPALTKDVIKFLGGSDQKQTAVRGLKSLHKAKLVKSRKVRKNGVRRTQFNLSIAHQDRAHVNKHSSRFLKGADSVVSLQELLRGRRNSKRVKISRARARTSESFHELRSSEWEEEDYTKSRTKEDQKEEKESNKEKEENSRTRKRALRRNTARERIKASRKRTTKVVFKESADTKADFDLAWDMAEAYEDKLAEYTKNPFLKYFRKPFGEEHRTYQYFLAAALEAKELKVKPEVWLEAQFYWIDRWLGRAPHTYELRGGRGKMPAMTRCRAYCAFDGLDNLQRTVDKISKKKIRVTKAEIIKYNEKLLEDMMSDGSSETDCLLEFAQEGMNVFDYVFLKQCPTYKRLVKEGRL
jgi:hypothetical protein